MSSIEQGEHILNGFFDELSKHAGWNPLRIVRGPNAEKALEIGKGIDKHQEVVQQVNKLHAEEKVLRETSKKGIDELNQVHSGMPVSEVSVAELEKQKKKVKSGNTAALAIGALGLGGLGFGYHQYKKQQDDQLGRAYPQVG